MNKVKNWFKCLPQGSMEIIKNLFLNSIAGAYACPKTLRYFIYRLFGNRIRSRNIAPKCFLGGRGLEIGKGCIINYEVFFDLRAPITIEDYVHVAYRCNFVTSTHNISDENHRCGPSYGKPIVVEKGCWIGAGVTILPGVTIGKGCIIAAGAVVSRDCEANCLYAGIPAKKIKCLPGIL